MLHIIALGLGFVRKWYYLFAVITLLCGAAIYPLFRGSDLLVWQVIPMPGFWEMLRLPVSTTSNLFMIVFVYSAPDFLWLLSGIFFLRGLWYFQPKTQTVYIIALYIIAAGWNAGQYFGVIPGTFCYVDLYTMSGVALAEGITYKFIVKKESKK